jgi:hypothetical protein
MTKILIALFLFAHAGIHASFTSPRPAQTVGGPAWPFDLTHSWLLTPLGLSPDITRVLGLALLSVTVGGFALAALAALGPAPASMWMPAVVVGAVASIGLLGMFFHPWLVLGIVIDVVLVWAVSIARWQPAF